MLITLLVVFTILYTLQICIFAIAAHNATYPNNPSYRPTVSVIIAARNEERNIGPCLESVSRLTYPKELLNVIVVNDHSTDGTESIITEYERRFPFIKLHSAAGGETQFKGKTNAVLQGIDITDGEIILFSDADCIVPPGWVEETVKYYDTESVGLVAGFTSLKSGKMFEAVQALDWFALFSIAAAAIRLHFPVTAVGNNLSVRRKAYNAVGGYRQIPFSITEDYALFHAVTTKTAYSAKFPLDLGTLVRSLPCGTWRELYRQKKRWFTGGADMDIKSISLFAVGYIFKSLLLLNLFFNGVAVILVPLLLKCFSDYLLIRPALTSFKRSELLLYIIPFELYYISYVLFFPPVVLVNKNVQWKERDFGKA